jgi:hypothetical protein
MPAFSLTDAAFEGFRLTREQPRVVGAWVGWALLYGLISVLTALIMAPTIGSEFTALRATAVQGAMSTGSAEAVRQSRALAPFLMIMLPVVLVFWSVFICAVYRAILRPKAAGFGRFRLGGDELRMMGLIVILFLLAVSTLAAYRIADSFGAVVSVSGGVPGTVVGNLIRFGAFLAIVGFWIRLSLAGPITYETREIHVFRSWTLTRGHFWRLAAAYGLALALALVVLLLALIIFMAAGLMFAMASGISLDHVDRVFQPDMTSVVAYFTPAQIFNQVFSAVLLVAVFVVLLSPAAIIHSALSRQGAVA